MRLCCVDNFWNHFVFCFIQRIISLAFKSLLHHYYCYKEFFLYCSPTLYIISIFTDDAFSLVSNIIIKTHYCYNLPLYIDPYYQYILQYACFLYIVVKNIIFCPWNHFCIFMCNELSFSLLSFILFYYYCFYLLHYY